MTTLTLMPSLLAGTVTAPSSKSMGHRFLICAALAQGESWIRDVSFSKDIAATRRCLEALGATIMEGSGEKGRKTYFVKGQPPHQKSPLMDCGESGSTLRFLIPLAALDGNCYNFIGEGELGTRPLTPYETLFKEENLHFHYGSERHFPLSVQGPLKSGHFVVPGDVSSQFISGLLFALPLLQRDSTIEITGSFESQSYVALTLSALSTFGVHVFQDEPRLYRVLGGQAYRPYSGSVEGDFSQAAFFLVAGALGKGISIRGVKTSSLQGDKAILPILQRMGAKLEEGPESLTIHPSSLHGIRIDASDCPDLVPILSVAAALAKGTTEIIHAERLRLKECDRLKAMASELTKMGAHIEERPDGLIIRGVPMLHGAGADSWNDHRVAMSLAIAATRSDGPVILTGSESVQKSYPQFWQDYESLGGKIK